MYIRVHQTPPFLRKFEKHNGDRTDVFEYMKKHFSFFFRIFGHHLGGPHRGQSSGTQLLRIFQNKCYFSLYSDQNLYLVVK